MDTNAFPGAVGNILGSYQPRYFSGNISQCCGNLLLSWEDEMKWWLIERWGFAGGLRRYGFTFARYYFARARHATMRDMDIIRISERGLSGARSSR